jgi:hypothetical protein
LKKLGFETLGIRYSADAFIFAAPDMTFEQIFVLNHFGGIEFYLQPFGHGFNDQEGFVSYKNHTIFGSTHIYIFTELRML